MGWLAFVVTVVVKLVRLFVVFLGTEEPFWHVFTLPERTMYGPTKHMIIPSDEAHHPAIQEALVVSRSTSRRSAAEPQRIPRNRERNTQVTNDHSRNKRHQTERHCGHEGKLTSGYHDGHYHANVIPAMRCEECGKDREGRTEGKIQGVTVQTV